MRKLSVLLFIIAICFMSCSKDDDEKNDVSNSKIVGKWQLIEVKINGKIEKPSSPSSIYIPCDYTSWFKCNADGSLEDYDDCDKKTTKGTWSLKDNSLSTIAPSIPFDMGVEVKELIDDKLVTYFDFGYQQELTYKKIK